MASAPDGWMETGELARAMKLLPERATQLLEDLQTENRVVQMDGQHWMAAESLASYRVEVRRHIALWFDENSHRARMDVRDLRSRVSLAPALLDAICQRLEQEGELIRQSGGLLLLPGHEPKISPDLQGLADKVTKTYSEAQFQPQALEEIASGLPGNAADLQRVVEFLCDTQALARISGDTFLDYGCMQRLRELVIDNCTRNGELQISELRDGLNTSRKFLIPMLEALDAEGLTHRKGGGRYLKAKG